MELVRADLDIAHWRDHAYWRARAPALHLNDADWWARQDGLTLSAPLLAASRAALLSEGYVQLDPVQWALPLDRMAALVSGLRQDGLPPVMAWLYDEFWAAHRQLLPLSAALLDGPVASLPNFWAWCIDPQTAESGWQPHRDVGRRALFHDGAPKIISYWLPLTAATPLNGCMYVVPADRDPTYNTEEDTTQPRLPRANEVASQDWLTAFLICLSLCSRRVPRTFDGGPCHFRRRV